MKKIVHIVDSVAYVQSNCFQHQLLDGLRRAGDVTSLTIVELASHAGQHALESADVVVSCLKMRTLHARTEDLARALGRRSMVVYDQDPWESFKADGACNGAYARAADAFDVRFFAVTTHAWEARLRRLGFKSRFVPMGMLPSYCTSSPRWNERPVDVGFVGQLHPYRLELFAALRERGVRVELVSGGNYGRYLAALSRIKVFVHREAGEYEVAGERVQYAEGMWAKDVETMARGCVSVRNWHPDAGHHMPERVLGCGLRMFEDGDVDTATRIIQDALQEPSALEPFVDHAKERAWCTQAVAEDDAWLEAARTLVEA